MRQCGTCTLCCKLMPMDGGRDNADVLAAAVEVGLIKASDVAGMVKDFFKEAGCRCPHQRHGKGCSIYAVRPFGCRTWSCRWLVNDDTADLSRPDRSHYVVDCMPDYVTNDGHTVPVIQVWLDPNYPDAHEDPALRAYLDRRGKEGWAALIRSSATKAFLLAPPSMNNGEWFIKHSEVVEREHTAEDKVKALGPITLTFKEAP
jgi:hypothetical protein